jgi:CheY-like chemotaxis protein
MSLGDPRERGVKGAAIVFMTAYAAPPGPELATLLEREAFATVSKPFNLDERLAFVTCASRVLAERVPVE